MSDFRPFDRDDETSRAKFEVEVGKVLGRGEM